MTTNGPGATVGIEGIKARKALPKLQVSVEPHKETLSRLTDCTLQYRSLLPSNTESPTTESKRNRIVTGSTFETCWNAGKKQVEL